MQNLQRFLLVILTSMLSSGQALADAAGYFGAALQGDLSNARAEIEAEPDAETRARLLARFTAQFVEQTDGLKLEAIEDPLVREAAAAYQHYWRQTLLEPARRAAHEAALNDALVAAMGRHTSSEEAPDDNNIQNRLQAEMLARGYHAILGRTPPLLEFMVWKNVEVQTYAVELSDGIQKVRVHFLTDFVSRGWAHFATFGRSSSGGWATDEGLFAIKESYDLESENFLVSYLKHEARHFADYALYPELQGADLEYRAKLTEIIYADTTRTMLLERFSRHAAPARDAPHALASWYLVRNLSRLIFGTEALPEGASWSGVAEDNLVSAARRLLDEHDAALRAAGAESIQGILKE